MRVSGMDFLVVSPERPAQGVRDLKRAGYRSIMLHVGVAFPQKEKTLEERVHTMCRGKYVSCPEAYENCQEVTD